MFAISYLHDKHIYHSDWSIIIWFPSLWYIWVILRGEEACFPWKMNLKCMLMLFSVLAASSPTEFLKFVGQSSFNAITVIPLHLNIACNCHPTDKNLFPEPAGLLLENTMRSLLQALRIALSLWVRSKETLGTLRAGDCGDGARSACICVVLLHEILSHVKSHVLGRVVGQVLSELLKTVGRFFQVAVILEAQPVKFQMCPDV